MFVILPANDITRACLRIASDGVCMQLLLIRRGFVLDYEIMEVQFAGSEHFEDSERYSSWETAVCIGRLSLKGVNIETLLLSVSFLRAGEMVRASSEG